MSEELKPCPFCGADNGYVDVIPNPFSNDIYSRGHCIKCHAVGTFFAESWIEGGNKPSREYMENKALEQWNNRPIEDELNRRIAELEEENRLYAKDNSAMQTAIDKFYKRAVDAEARIAELEEQAWNLNLENERLEEAYFIDETIVPDGSLKPSVRKLLERLEKAETDLSLSAGLIDSLIARIAELEAERRWIPVRERLPEFNKVVAVIDMSDKDSHLCNVYETAILVEVRGDTRFGFIGHSGWDSSDVTHWMPLPKLPEVQG